MPKAITKYTTNCRTLPTLGRGRFEKGRPKRIPALDEAAAIPLDAMDLGERPIPLEGEWIDLARGHYTVLALGAHMLTRTPDELIAGKRDIGVKGWLEVEEAFRTTTEWFDGLGKTMACIHARWLCAAARSVVEGGV